MLLLNGVSNRILDNRKAIASAARLSKAHASRFSTLLNMRLQKFVDVAKLVYPTANRASLRPMARVLVKKYGNAPRNTTRLANNIRKSHLDLQSKLGINPGEERRIQLDEGSGFNPARDMKIFSNAISNGALPSLTKLYLGGNKIGDEGMQAFAAAVGSGALPSLTTLELWENQISDDGMKAFAAAVGSGALPSLTKLYLWYNKIGDEGMQAFAAAVGSGALPNLVTLKLFGNPASLASRQAAQDAIKSSWVEISL